MLNRRFAHRRRGAPLVPSTRSVTGSEPWRSDLPAPSDEMACASSAQVPSSGALTMMPGVMPGVMPTVMPAVMPAVIQILRPDDLAR